LQRKAHRRVSLAKRPVGKSDDSTVQFSTQVFIVVFWGRVPFRGYRGVPFQYICADLDNVIRGYADNKGVVSGMMQLAQRQSILDRGLSFGQIVWNDMGGIEQFAMFQTEQSPLTSSSLPRLDLKYYTTKNSEFPRSSFSI
jgi:hypothetical protein